jgi:nucleoside-triphosphatase THEP1
VKNTAEVVMQNMTNSYRVCAVDAIGCMEEEPIQLNKRIKNYSSKKKKLITVVRNTSYIPTYTICAGHFY